MYNIFQIVAVAALVSRCLAVPTYPEFEKRQLSSVLSAINSVVSGVQADATEAAAAFGAILGELEALVPTATPTSIPEATSILSSIFSSTPTDLAINVAELIVNDFTPGDLAQIEITYSAGCSSDTNINPKEPSTPIYPQKSPSDAPYSLPSTTLQQAIYIPTTFTYGATPPIVLVPGTGSTGCLTFGSNYIKLLTGTPYADPVWLNVPHFMLDDAQQNAEFIAYAINYISGISNNANVSVIAWSQGNLDTQWALKYWPSTRSVLSDFICISPDFHGTELAYVACPAFPATPCPPAEIQQEYNSNYVTRLRENGGDAAFVPTTTVYSGTDEIVEPQQGNGASAYLNGASNNYLQGICPGLPAGEYVTHEGVLYNAIAYALAIDALTHDGPGDISRIDTETVCQELAAPGLSLGDVIATEGTIPVAEVAILLYRNKTTTEPPLMAYATY